MKVSYIHLICHELRCFTALLIPLKPGWEEEIIITHNLPFFVICLNSYTRNLDRSSPLFGSWLVKVIEGIRHDISRKPTRTRSGWKVSMTRNLTLKMYVYDLLLHSIWGLLVEQQQWLLPFELLVQTSLSPQDPPTGQGSLLTTTSYQPISSGWSTSGHTAS